MTDDDGLDSFISSMMSYQCNTIKAPKKDANAFVDELLLLSTKYHNLLMLI